MNVFFACIRASKLMKTAAFKLAPIKSATNLQFSAGLFVNAKKVQFVLVKVPINRDKTAPAPDLIGRLNSAL